MLLEDGTTLRNLELVLEVFLRNVDFLECEDMTLKNKIHPMNNK